MLHLLHINAKYLRIYKNMRVYLLKRGIYEKIYSNIKKMCEYEELEYNPVYRSLRKRKSYSSDDVFINEKEII